MESGHEQRVAGGSDVGTGTQEEVGTAVLLTRKSEPYRDMEYVMGAMFRSNVCWAVASYVLEVHFYDE